MLYQTSADETPIVSPNSSSSWKQFPDAITQVPSLSRDLPQPPSLQEQDRRFAPLRRDRVYCCDCCVDVCSYKSETCDSGMFFDGGCVQTPPSSDVSVLHRSWLNCQWGASWNCSHCMVLQRAQQVTPATLAQVRADLCETQVEETVES